MDSGAQHHANVVTAQSDPHTVNLVHTLLPAPGTRDANAGLLTLWRQLDSTHKHLPAQNEVISEDTKNLHFLITSVTLGKVIVGGGNTWMK